MKINKRRRIIIKNPQLRRIRNSLRQVIELEALRREEKLMDKKHSMMLDKSGKYFGGDRKKIIKAARKLTKKIWEIERPLRDSIIECAVCGHSDRDMEYIPEEKAWFCLDCAQYLP
ncbi:MAG: hypothetical protein ACTSRH_14745 [Promethearchaeota archaeon]